MNNNSNIILQATGLTELNYGNMVFDAAQEWMNLYFGDEPIIKKALNASKFFWAWWSNQWENRDTSFVEQIGLNEMCFPLEDRYKIIVIELYNERHTVNALKIHPNRFVFNDAFKVIKEEKLKLENHIKELKNGR